MKNNSLIRTLYLYIFALLGLVLIIIGGVRFLDMGLKTFVFTKADQEYNYRYPTPVKEIDSENTEEQCPELISQSDYITSRRQEDASINLALILIGLPLYLYHWTLIKREIKQNV